MNSSAASPALSIKAIEDGDIAEVDAFYQSLGYFEQQRVVFAKWLDGRKPTP